MPEWLPQKPIEIVPKIKYNPNPFPEIAREKIEIYDKQLNKVLTESMINPYYIIDRILQVRFIIPLDSHHYNHANSNSTNKTNNIEFGIESLYFQKFLKEIATIYDRFLKSI